MCILFPGCKWVIRYSVPYHRFVLPPTAALLLLVCSFLLWLSYVAYLTDAGGSIGLTRSVCYRHAVWCRLSLPASVSCLTSHTAISTRVPCPCVVSLLHSYLIHFHSTDCSFASRVCCCDVHSTSHPACRVCSSCVYVYYPHSLTSHLELFSSRKFTGNARLASACHPPRA